MIAILFDIDGTLILTGGAGQEAMGKVMARSTEPKRSNRKLRFAGRTDRSIIMDHFRHFGIEDTAENYRWYCEEFLLALPEQLHERGGQVLPGVIEILDRLSRRADVLVGLLTGNLRRAARIKLDHFGLSHYFYSEGEALGGFGDQHSDRSDVARDALTDLRARARTNILPEDVWIVGDTPNDVRCARAIGAKVLAVATGGFSPDQLSDAEPDVCAEDLTQADSWWESL